MESQAVVPQTECTRASPSLFQNTSFLFLWGGQLVSTLGNSIYTLALLWEMKVLTGSTVMMSAVAVSSLVPLLVFGPFAGVLVDRWPKRTAMICSDVIRAVVIAVLTLVVMMHWISPWMLLLGAALNSTVASVFSPAVSAIVPLLVGKEKLQQANSITQATNVLTQIIGPFVGGILVAHVSMTAAFAINAISFLGSVIGLLLMRYREPVRNQHKLSGKQFITEMKEGLDVIRQIRIIRVLAPVGLIANFLFAPIELVLVQYSTVTLHGDAQLYGTLGAFFSTGLLAGAVLAGTLAKKIRRGLLIAITFPLSTVPVFCMAFTHTAWVAMLLLGISGLFNMMVNVLLMTILQMQIPEEKMGRVFGSFGTLIQGSQPFALAIGGYLLSVFSAPILLAFIGSLTTMDAVVTLCSKLIRNQE